MIELAIWLACTMFVLYVGFIAAGFLLFLIAAPFVWMAQEIDKIINPTDWR